MPKLTINLSKLPAELRSTIEQDLAALRVAIGRTLAVDAQRWIQWSIRGGGAGASVPRTAPEKPSKSKNPPVKKTARKKVLAPLRTPLERRSGRIAKPPGPGKLTARSPCPPKKPAGYRKPIDTGDYANSWRHEMTANGGIFFSDASPPIKAGVIEHGRRAAPIPIAPLADWVRRKLGCSDPKKARSIAFAISKSAAKTPRKGLKVLERAHPKIAEALADNVLRELMKVKSGT